MMTRRALNISSFKQMLAALAIMLCAMCLFTGQLHAQQTICATVKVEIQQTFSFERQAFDAKMLITNGLSDLPIENVSIAVNFTDQDGNPVLASSDPDNEEATFFIVVSSMTGIEDISGAGTIEPSSVGEVHWLIIPAPNAAGGVLSGKLYFVGATIQYKINGDAKVFEAAADFITVKPQPEFELDYFLPQDVYGDDPFTPAIEPPVPFTLGVRVKNIGIAPANNATIESAQPQIVENLQGLLVGFSITSSFVDNDPAQPTLLLNFGSIAATSARIGRWIMETTLNGKFISFGATFTHADELGGELTSLVNEVHTHPLIKDVLVDLPGRDNVLDFLADSAGILKVYESHGLDTIVTDQSNLVSLVYNGSSNGLEHYYIDIPNTAGGLYVSVPDPFSGTKAVHGASRADGKILPPSNAWFARKGMGSDSTYWLRLFDVNGGGRYFIDVGDPVVPPSAPVVLPIPNYSMVGGGRMAFLVFGNNYNPGGPPPQMSVDSLPLGATFKNFEPGGIGLFDWQTTSNQIGTYPVTFRATVGTSSGARTPILKVIDPSTIDSDTDNDGLPDDWELANFGSLDRDGQSDLDGDGLSDLEEFQRGLDPTSQANAPSVPLIQSPLTGQKVNELRQTLSVYNTKHGVQIPTYEFQLATNDRFENASVATLNESQIRRVTGWKIPADLVENTRYYWRARASLAVIASEWVYGDFLVSQANDNPEVAEKVYPLAGEVVDGQEVALTVANSTDPEGDEVHYEFELRDSSEPKPQTKRIVDIPAGSTGFTTVLTEIPEKFVPPYYWRAIAVDSGNKQSEGEFSLFQVRAKGIAPSAPLPLSPIADKVIAVQEGKAVELLVKRAYDPDARRGGRYVFELSNDRSFATVLEHSEVRGGVTVIRSKVTSALVENTKYYWRVRSADNFYFGPWAYASFIVDSQNDTPNTPVVMNPERSARVDSLKPTLRLFAGSDPDPELPDSTAMMYHFEIFKDPQMTILVTDAKAAVPFVQVPIQLENHTMYYWRARTLDGAGVYSEWNAPSAFFVSKDLINDIPTIQVVSPVSPTALTADKALTFEWVDADPDSDATLLLSVDGQKNEKFVLQDLHEDLDGDNDRFTLPPFSLSPGSHQISLMINDESVTVYAQDCCTVTVLPAVLTNDSDGDGVFDQLDNCPHIGNPDQEDRGGFRSKLPDGIGDRCQCGDFSADGKIDRQDLNVLGLALRKGTQVGLPHLELCNVAGHLACNNEDYIAMRKALRQRHGTRLKQMCEAANP